MNPPDAPTDTIRELDFRLEEHGRSYGIGVRWLCVQPLSEGLLEHSYVEPDEALSLLEDWRLEELERISFFEAAVSRMSGRSGWVTLTPTPAADDPEFQAPERIFGWLCAAVLRSYDDFPVPSQGEEGEEPADYAEACVLYVVRRSEGLLPESVRSRIRWEAMARPMLV